MRRICLAVVPALLVLTSCIQPDGSPRGDASPSPPASSPSEASVDLPDPVSTCSLLVGSAEVGLTEQQAITATDLAADALDAGTTPRELVAAMSRLPGAPLNGARLNGTAAARALLGYDGPALSCLYGRVVLRDEPLGPTGLTPRAERLRREIRRSFGDVAMGGFASGGVSLGHGDNSSHYDGRAIDPVLRHLDHVHTAVIGALHRDDG